MKVDSEFFPGELFPIDTLGYALVLTNKLLTFSADEQRYFDSIYFKFFLPFVIFFIVF